MARVATFILHLRPGVGHALLLVRKLLLHCRYQHLALPPQLFPLQLHLQKAQCSSPVKRRIDYSIVVLAPNYKVLAVKSTVLADMSKVLAVGTSFRARSFSTSTASDLSTPFHTSFSMFSRSPASEATDVATCGDHYITLVFFFSDRCETEADTSEMSP